MTAFLKHSLLGDMRGVRKDGVVQFLGIKFASLGDRYAPSEILDHPKNAGVIDATKLGPMVLSPLGACEMEQHFIQCSLPESIPSLGISELDGLNLNITVPTLPGDLPPGKKLSVFVFVHGGGFGIGSNSWPQYDQGRIVKLSSDMDLPVIGVGINYRLGLPGFLTSVEMIDAGYKTNNGLRDQINALRWIKNHISGFGGDPEEITLVGESAGAVSGSLLLHTEEPLFKRFMSMSGSSLMMQPLPPSVSEFAYSKTLKSLGLEKLAGPERIEGLLSAPVKGVNSRFPPPVPLMPVIDGDLIPRNATFSQISGLTDDRTLSMPGKKWCEELLMGDCQFDASIFSGALEPRKPGIAKKFVESMKQSLPLFTVEKLLKSYNIAPDLEDRIAVSRILQFATDIGFFAPALSFAKGWPGKAYLYHFNEPNPWEGEWKGKSTHILDVAFLFQNYSEHLSSAQRQVSKSFAEDVIKFVNGKAPWKEFENGNEGAQVYGPSDDGVSSIYIEGLAGRESGRSQLILSLAEDVSLDELSAAWGKFFAEN